MIIDPVSVIFGVAIGFLVGMTGMGGGTLSAPLFILLFGVRPVAAVGTALLYMTVTRIIGGVQHRLQGSVDIALLKYLAIGAIPASLVGVLTVALLNFQIGSAIDLYVQRLLAFTMLGVALLLTIQLIMRRNGHHVDDPGHVSLHLKNRLSAVSMGGLVGFVVSVTSVGSGTLLMPLLMLLFPLATSRLVGTTVAITAMISAVGGGGYLLLGFVDVTLLLSMLLGSIPGVLVGARLNHRMPPRLLRGILVLLIFASSIALILR